MKITEIFYSIQGEGKNIGEPAIFIRLSGCNLKCKFCDTKRSWKDGKNYTVKELIMEIKKYPCNHIIWTGGEPTLQQDEILKVINSLGSGWYHELETNGTNFLKDPYIFNLITISPKKETKVYYNSPNSVFKFIIDNKSEYKRAKSWVKKNNIPLYKVYMMPEGMNKQILTKRGKWLVKECKKDNFNYSHRLQYTLGLK